MTKILSGAELAGFVKERQAGVVAALCAEGIAPKLAIVRDNDSPVIAKYVALKQAYGADIGVEVVDLLTADLGAAVQTANSDRRVSGIIVQMPLMNPAETDPVVKQIIAAKDVDGLSKRGNFDSATATAINWLLAGHNIDLSKMKIALVGRGRLVGEPLAAMWQTSGYDVTSFQKGDELAQLVNYDLVVTATGVPRLITSDLIKAGAVVVDAGTASEDGVLVGDLDESVRARADLLAITPKIGGVGPLTVSVLFENVITAAQVCARRSSK